MSTKKNAQASFNASPFRSPAPLPASGAPVVPVDASLPTGGVSRRYLHALEAQVIEAPGVANELKASTTYVADFGARVPDADTVAKMLAVAVEWTLEEARASAWQVYANAQKQIAWNQALGTLLPFGRILTHLTAIGSDIGARYPLLTAFFSERKTLAVRAAKSRAAKGKAVKSAVGATPPKTA